MTTEGDKGLFKFKAGKIRKKKQNKQKGNKNKNNSHKKDKLSHVHPKGKINKKKDKVLKKSPVKREGGYDIQQLEGKIQALKEVEEPTKKIRKKLRQLEHLHRKITQQLLTEKSLGIDQDNKTTNSDLNEENPDSATNDKNTVDSPEEQKEDESESSDEDKTGTKRFVLFVGNLSKDATENNIQQHFAKVGGIKSVRIPESKESRKSGFAFIELEDRISYEKTLSMHHTMLNNKRINVLYTIPDGKAFDKKEIMKKNAKLDALRKAGKLAGSIAQHKKRSFRRKKKRLAEAKATASLNQH